MKFGDVLEEAWPQHKVKWSPEATEVFNDILNISNWSKKDEAHLRTVMNNALLTYDPKQDMLDPKGNNWSITKAREYIRGLIKNWHPVSGRSDIQKRLERVFS